MRARMIVGWISAKMRVTSGSASAWAMRVAQSSSSSTACAGAALSAAVAPVEALLVGLGEVAGR